VDLRIELAGGTECQPGPVAGVPFELRGNGVHRGREIGGDRYLDFPGAGARGACHGDEGETEETLHDTLSRRGR